MPEDAAIRTEHLTRRYGQRAVVDQLNLVVPRGDVFGLLGPNGAGKTTTLTMLLGLVKPTSGQAWVLGHDIAADPVSALQHVGATIEAPAFYPYLSAYDNLRVLTMVDHLPTHRIDAVLRQVDLHERARQPFRTFSQGMKQRLAIAAALLAEPELIILDEPTNGLDPAGTAAVRDLIRALAAAGHTIILSSHLLHEVQQVCQHVAILKQGRLIAQGAVADLLHERQQVLIEVEGDVQAAVNALRDYAPIESVTTEGNRLHINAPPQQTAAINARLVQHGIPVVMVNARTASLEDLFLDVTQEA